MHDRCASSDPVAGFQIVLMVAFFDRPVTVMLYTIYCAELAFASARGFKPF